MSEKKFLYWMAVSENEAVRFSELAHLMAKAQYPTDAELGHYGVTRLTLEDELPNVVRDGGLIVRNPAGLGALTYPHGAVLQSAVILPHDLRPFLAERGIELRLTPHGSGPEYWTLENVAAALQAQEGWNNGTRAVFQDQLQEAAQRGEIPIRGPQTCLPIKSPQPRTNWELVTPADVNAWLEKQGAPYRWDVDAETPQPQAAAPAPKAVLRQGAQDTPDWISKAQARAREYIAEMRARDLYPSQVDVADLIAREFREAGIVGAGGKPLAGSYIKRHALAGISSEVGKRLSPSIRRGK